MGNAHPVKFPCGIQQQLPLPRGYGGDVGQTAVFQDVRPAGRVALGWGPGGDDQATLAASLDQHLRPAILGGSLGQSLVGLDHSAAKINVVAARRGFDNHQAAYELISQPGPDPCEPWAEEFRQIEVDDLQVAADFSGNYPDPAPYAEPFADRSFVGRRLLELLPGERWPLAAVRTDG